MSTSPQQSARDAILAAVRAARPPAVARPAARVRAAERASGGLTLLDEFVNAATVGGAAVVVTVEGDVARLARGAEVDGGAVYSLVSGVPSTVAEWGEGSDSYRKGSDSFPEGSDSSPEGSDSSQKESDPYASSQKESDPNDPHALASLDLFVCSATLGVAENGAVWIAPENGWQRAALFLAQRVVVVVRAESIVADLHDAYARIDLRARPFGVFVAGPSKTADIEQSLVIGAHGPKELTMLVVDQPGGSATAP